jgi:hypothetical protein
MVALFARFVFTGGVGAGSHMRSEPGFKRTVWASDARINGFPTYLAI